MLEVKATSKYLRTSAQKAGLVLELIRGKKAADALAILRFTKKSIARDVEKTLRSAVDQVPASIPLTKILTEDPIREALICQIKSGKYDLVVMGSRGRGAPRMSRSSSAAPS